MEMDRVQDENARLTTATNKSEKLRLSASESLTTRPASTKIRWGCPDPAASSSSVRSMMLPGCRSACLLGAFVSGRGCQLSGMAVCQLTRSCPPAPS
jgi:hypothetical protein